MQRHLLWLVSLVLVACSAAGDAGTQTPPRLPTAAPSGLLGVWRVRHDVERERWDFKSRLWVEDWKKLRGLPETVRIHGGRGTVEA